jgi:hypothetical protein
VTSFAIREAQFVPDERCAWMEARDVA